MSVVPESTLDFRAQYEKRRRAYSVLVDVVKSLVSARCLMRGMHVLCEGRAKEVASAVEKATRKGYQNPIVEMTDLAGVRAVCQYGRDASEVIDVIRNSFQVIEETDKSARKLPRLGHNG